MLRELLQKIALHRGESFLSPEDLEATLDDFIPNHLLKNDTLRQALGITPTEMELLYKEGYTHYQHSAYPEAATCFRMLLLLDPYLKKYWIGLAATEQLRGRFEKALHAYAIAALLDADDPYPHYYAYECYTALGNQEESLKALELALVRAQENPSHSHLARKIEKLKTTSLTFTR